MDEKAKLLGEYPTKKRKFRVDVWWEWLTQRYREPLDLNEFWYTGDWVADLYALPNWSLCSHYVNIGIALNLLSTPVTFYLVENLNASSAVSNTYLALTYLPWCLKIFFGLTSDLVPWLGMHRRSYYAFGWLIFFLSNVWLAVLARPGIAATLLLSLTMTMGALLADTVADAMVLEATHVGGDNGIMRTRAYIVRQIGSTIGSLLGAVIYNSAKDGGDWSWGLSIGECFRLQALIPGISLFPLLLFMSELPISSKPSFKALWEDTLYFVSNQGVFIPLFYLYFYNLCFVSNPAWYNFLYDGLNFSNFEVGVLYTVGSLLSALGLVVYEKYFFKSAWRPLYLWTTLIGALFSVLQVLLVTGNTFGIPPIFFATGDAALQDFVLYLVFIPMCIMFFALIPPGTEGTLYALLSTWQNVASEVGYDVGTALACGVNVSNSALENGNYNGVLKLTIICSCIQILPVFFIYATTPSGVRLLPNNIAQTKAQCEPGRRSNVGAAIFFFVFFGSILASMAEALYVIFYPAAC